MTEPFSWRDGERLIRFGADARLEAAALLAEQGFESYALITTKRAQEAVPGLADAADTVVEVPAGRVDELYAQLLDAAGERPPVPLGGGRVIDVAKAIAGARGGCCAAIPTTLSGAELTPFHRLPVGVPGARMVRPALVVADPELMTSQPPPQLAASAMNALAHALEALYTPLANPVCESAALRAAELLARGLDGDGHSELTLGALLAGYASGCTGIAVHHALCQSIVRTAGTPHAQTNAVMLPHSARLMASRAPAALGAFAAALGDPVADPEAAAGLVARLAALCGHTRLGPLGVEEQQLSEIAAVATEHPALANTPSPPGEAELVALLRAAL